MPIRIEHWGMAQIHGQVVAKNMVRGNVVKCENIPFFWTQQYSKSIKYSGHALKYDRVIVDLGGEDIQFENPKICSLLHLQRQSYRHLHHEPRPTMRSIRRNPLSRNPNLTRTNR